MKRRRFVFERIVLVLSNGGLMPQSEFEYFNQELRKLEEKLRSSKDVSEANGFAREAIKSLTFFIGQEVYTTQNNKP